MNGRSLAREGFYRNLKMKFESIFHFAVIISLSDVIDVVLVDLVASNEVVE